MGSDAAAYFPDGLTSTLEVNGRGRGITELRSGSVLASEDQVEGSARTVTQIAEISDELLMEQVRQGSREALVPLFRRHAHAVRSVACRILRNDAEADDLVQEVFLFVFRKAPLFDPSQGTARSWIVQVTYHRAIDRRRYLSSRRYYTFEDVDASAQEPPDDRREIASWEKSLEGVWGRKTAAEIRSLLSADQMRTIELHFFSYQALQVKFQRSVSHGLQALGSYTWSHSLDFGSNDYVLPAIRGNSDFDIRNNFQGGISWEIPSPCTGFCNVLVRDWGVDARAMARSGFPITLDGNYLTDPATGSQYYGNLDLVPGQPLYLYGSSHPGGRAVNPAAFAYPNNNGAGDAPRNFVRGFGATQINLAARRQIKLREDLSLQFRAETFNLLNHPNFGYVDRNLGDATFGQATQMLNQSLGTVAAQYQQGGPRSMQFALKLSF